MDAVVRRIVVHGRVQGVGYRAWVANEARALGLEGWVRNRRDGTVEAVLAGPTETVIEMIARGRRGPAPARVDAIDETPGDDRLLGLRGHERFAVLPTV